MFAHERTQGWSKGAQCLGCWLPQYSGEQCTFSNWQTMLKKCWPLCQSVLLFHHCLRYHHLSSEVHHPGSEKGGGKSEGGGKGRGREWGRENENGKKVGQEWKERRPYIRQAFMHTWSWHHSFITTICYSFPILAWKALEMERNELYLNMVAQSEWGGILFWLLFHPIF